MLSVSRYSWVGSETILLGRILTELASEDIHDAPETVRNRKQKMRNRRNMNEEQHPYLPFMNVRDVALIYRSPLIFAP
jgi:hypothetical protein